jgi:hypothetical protein
MKAVTFLSGASMSHNLRAYKLFTNYTYKFHHCGRLGDKKLELHMMGRLAAASPACSLRRIKSNLGLLIRAVAGS